MDLKIPLETRRFHPDVIEELIGKGFFDDVDKMDDKMYMVHNPEYRIINHTEYFVRVDDTFNLSSVGIKHMKPFRVIPVIPVYLIRCAKIKHLTII